MNKKLTIFIISLSLLALVLSGCGEKKEVVVKNNPPEVNTIQNENLAKVADYEKISNLKLQMGESSLDEVTGKMIVPISLVKNGDSGFDSKTIQGITFTIENLPKEVKSLNVKNVELTKDWMFASNLDETGGYLKASMITLEKMSDLGIVASLTLDKNELDYITGDLIISTEITDGVKMYKLEEVKLKLKN